MTKTREEYMETVRAIKDEMNETDLMLIGGWVRLEVPFHSVAALRKWSDLMKGFLAEVDFHCQPRGPGMPYLEERARLSALRTHAVIINRTMRGHKGPGRPRGARTKRYLQETNTVDNVTKIK